MVIFFILRWGRRRLCHGTMASPGLLQGVYLVSPAVRMRTAKRGLPRSHYGTDSTP